MRDIISAAGGSQVSELIKSSLTVSGWMAQVVSESLTVRGAAGEASSSPCVQHCEQTVVIKQTMNVFYIYFLLFILLSLCPCISFFLTHIHLPVALTLCLLFIHVVRFNAQVCPCQVPKQGFLFSWSTFYACYIFPLPPHLSFSGCFFVFFVFFYTHDVLFLVWWLLCVLSLVSLPCTVTRHGWRRSTSTPNRMWCWCCSETRQGIVGNLSSSLLRWSEWEQ